MSGYCPDCGNTLCVCDEVTKATFPYREEIIELKKKLDEAVEVLEIISNSKYEANPWTLVPSKESLIAKEFLKGLK